MMGGMGFGSFGLLGGVLNLILTLGLIVGFVWLVVWGVGRLAPSAGTRHPGGADGATPREILQARYARGEITREQYQQMLADLS